MQALKVGGHLVLMKANYKEELESTKKIISKYNLVLKSVVEFTLPFEQSKRTIVDFYKVEVTPSVYPRNIQKIKMENLK